MNDEIEALYQEIGNLALDEADDEADKVLLYAEVKQGFYSVDVAWEVPSSSKVKLRFADDELQDKIYSLWKKWRKLPQAAEWRGLACYLDQGKFKIELVYPDAIDEMVDTGERRNSRISEFFGSKSVEYVNSSFPHLHE